MKALPAHDAHDGVAAKLLPPARGLTVVHHKVRVSELARRAEIENPVPHRAFENEGGIAKRAIGDSHGRFPDTIVHDLMPDQDAQGIGPRVAANGERDDRLCIADAASPSGCNAIGEPLEARRVDRWNIVPARPARLNLLQRDSVLREVRAGPLRSPASRLDWSSARGRADGRGDKRRRQHYRSDAVSEPQLRAAGELYCPPQRLYRDLPRVDLGYSLDCPKRLPVGCATTAVPAQRLDRQDASESIGI